MGAHPNGTYSSVATNFGTQLGHHNYSVPPTTLPSLQSTYHPTTSYHSTLGVLTSAPQTVLPYTTVQSTYSMTGSTYSTVGTNAYGASGVSSG